MQNLGSASGAVQMQTILEPNPPADTLEAVGADTRVFSGKHSSIPRRVPCIEGASPVGPVHTKPGSACSYKCTRYKCKLLRFRHTSTQYKPV